MLLDLSSVSGVIVVGALLSFPARVNSVWRVAFNWSTSASFGRGDQVDGLPRPYNEGFETFGEPLVAIASVSYTHLRAPRDS